MDALTRSVSRASPAIVKPLDAKRRAMGLPEVRMAGDPSTLLVIVRSDGSTYTVPSPAVTTSRIAALRARAAGAVGRLRAAGGTSVAGATRWCR